MDDGSYAKAKAFADLMVKSGVQFTPPEQMKAAMNQKVTVGQATKAKYVIISDCDAPQPDMVCQWVPGVGYCYLDRIGNKSQHDGMQGEEATSIEAFGFLWVEDPDGVVRFYQVDRPVTATYRDGAPRRWQSREKSFQFFRLATSVVAKKKRKG